ncbi:hypothetical protein VPH35_055295 [Triticum aestivum]|uniref:Uncharacterized protein n=1 Tax=Triticum aestivum TaxID=4565 RepID=A0A077S3Z5_WHEAT|nr:unnamed protein product [Triticum aestivum]
MGVASTTTCSGLGSTPDPWGWRRQLAAPALQKNWLYRRWPDSIQSHLPTPQKPYASATSATAPLEHTGVTSAAVTWNARIHHTSGLLYLYRPSRTSRGQRGLRGGVEGEDADERGKEVAGVEDSRAPRRLAGLLVAPPRHHLLCAMRGAASASTNTSCFLPPWAPQLPVHSLLLHPPSLASHRRTNLPGQGRGRSPWRILSLWTKQQGLAERWIQVGSTVEGGSAGRSSRRKTLMWFGFASTSFLSFPRFRSYNFSEATTSNITR